jgi:hypothetical protein
LSSDWLRYFKKIAGFYRSVEGVGDVSEASSVATASSGTGRCVELLVDLIPDLLERLFNCFVHTRLAEGH